MTRNRIDDDVASLAQELFDEERRLRACVERVTAAPRPQERTLVGPLSSLVDVLVAQGKYTAARAFLRRLESLLASLHGQEAVSVRHARQRLASLEGCDESFAIEDRPASEE